MKTIPECIIAMLSEYIIPPEIVYSLIGVDGSIGIVNLDIKDGDLYIEDSILWSEINPKILENKIIELYGRYYESKRGKE